MGKEIYNYNFDDFGQLPLLEVSDNWKSSLEVKLTKAKRTQANKLISISRLPLLAIGFFLLNGFFFYAIQKSSIQNDDSRQEALRQLSDELLINTNQTK